MIGSCLVIERKTDKFQFVWKELVLKVETDGSQSMVKI